MSTVRLFVVLLAVNLISGYVLRKALLKNFKQCEKAGKLPTIFSNFVIYQVNKGEYFMDGWIDVKEDYPSGWMLKVAIYKCSDRYNYDSCEIYIDKLKSEDGCEIYEKLTEMYRSIFKSIVPSLDCPMKAGRYDIQKCALTKYLNAYAAQSTSPTYLFKIEGHFDEKTLFCFESRIDITNRAENVEEANNKSLVTFDIAEN